MSDSLRLNEVGEHPEPLGVVTHAPRRADIDGLRGVAVLAVVAFHFFPELMPGGFVGVDVFFVISGFVITNLLIRQQPATRRALALFWGRRVRRLFPALAIVVFSTLVFGWFLLWPAQFESLGESATWSAAMLGNVYAYSETNYFAADPTWNPLLNLWSLGVEEQFYFVWPVLFAALWWVARKRLGTILLVVVSLGTASWYLGLVYGSGELNQQTVSATFYLPWFRAWELLAGAAVALLLNQIRSDAGSHDRDVGSILRIKRSRPVQSVTVALYLLLMIALVTSLIWPYSSERPSVFAWPVVVATAGLILLGSFVGSPTRLFANSPFLWLGKISYPLYLWHWPVLVLGIAVGFADSLRLKTLLVLVSVLLAWLTWRLVEKPIQTRQVNKTMVLTLTGSMIFVGVLGFGLANASMNRITNLDLAAVLDSYSSSPELNYGNGDCFIEGGDNQDPAELALCLPDSSGTPKVLLWGDSHAASMDYGITESLPGEIVIQLTTAGCEPSLEVDVASAVCITQTELALKALSGGEIRAVILAAWWRDGYEPQRLVRLVQKIKEISDAQIVVVGPLPRWSPALPRVWSPTEIANMERLPLYTKHGLMQDPFNMESQLRLALKGQDVTYVSPLESMCTDEGCRVSVDGNPETLTAWDYGHLTKSGSELLGKDITSTMRR